MCGNLLLFFVRKIGGDRSSFQHREGRGTPAEHSLASASLPPSLPGSANCPVFGRPDAAAGGTLVAVPAGAPAARERLAPLLQSFSGLLLGLLGRHLAACFLVLLCACLWGA